MEDTRKELERIQQELLKEEKTIDTILEDEELNALLEERSQPAFDDPEKIHDPEEPMVYQNFANDYGATRVKRKDNKTGDEKVILGLMITACALCLGIICVLGYWLGVLL